MPGSFILQHVLEDPMLSKSELDLRRLYYPLGVPLEVQTNSRLVMEAASETWGRFSKSFEIPPMRLALGVRDGAHDEPLSLKSTFLTREHSLALLMTADNFVVSDFLQAFSFGWIPPELASDPATLRYRLLTPTAV